MKYIKILILLLSVCIASNAFSQFSKVIKETHYYQSGELEYKVKTKFYGYKNEFKIKGKTVIKLREYYKNGQLEMKERKVLPKAHHEKHLSETTRHVMPQRQTKRKWKMYDQSGVKMEKGKQNFHGKKRTIKYNFMGHKRIVVKFDSDSGRPIEIKKKPIYKPKKVKKVKRVKL